MGSHSHRHPQGAIETIPSALLGRRRQAITHHQGQSNPLEVASANLHATRGLCGGDDSLWRILLHGCLSSIGLLETTRFCSSNSVNHSDHTLYMLPKDT